MKLTTSKTNNYNKLVLTAVIVVLTVLFYILYYSQQKNERGYAYVEVKPFQTVAGWGYEITTNGKTYIRQTFIPAVEGEKSFKTKDEALRVGNKVVEKMKAGQQLPSISIDELKQMGVLPDSAK